VFLFVVDSTTGVTEDDEALAQWLRRIARCCWSPTRPTTGGERTTLGVPLAPAVTLSHQCAARPTCRRSARRGGLPSGHRGPKGRWPVDLEDASGLWKAGDTPPPRVTDRQPSQRRQRHLVQPSRRR
jgi:hypothetical protein